MSRFIFIFLTFENFELMDKKPGFIIIFFLFIGATIGFYIFLKNKQTPSVEIFAAIPVNAALVAEINQPIGLIYSVKQKNQFIRELAGLHGIKDIISSIYFFDSIGSNSNLIREHYTFKKLVFSFHEVGNKKYEVLFLIAVEGYFESNSSLKAIQKELEKGGTINTYRYDQVKIHHFQSAESNFYFSYHRGVLMGSVSELLLQDAIRQVASDVGIYSDPGFQKVRKTAGNHVDANIYINLKTSATIISKLFNSDVITKKGMNQIGEWVELDLNLKSQSMVFNGFANNSGNSAHFYSLFRDQAPQNLDFIKFLPSNIESFCGFGLSNYKLYLQNFQNYMERTNQSERYLINRQLLTATFGEGFDQQLGDIFKGELAQVSLSGGETLFFIRTKGYRSAHEYILKLLNDYCQKNKTTINEFKTEFKIDNDTKFPIYKMPIDFFPTRLLGPWFKDCQANYVTIFDEYIIFGESYQSLSKTVYNNVLQKTLIYDATFNQFSDFLSNKVNYYSYLSFVGTGDILLDLLDKKAFEYYELNQVKFRDFYGLAWQFSNENQMIYNSLLFKYQPAGNSKSKAEWETRLDTTIAAKPELVINHTTKEKEIFVQDAKSNIYLINKSGRILWKKNLKEPIMGEVLQVDYYKNGKLQFLFNTRTQIHLIDRNGNFVEHYPITLPAAAAQSMTLVDYDKQRNYRFFVPGEDKKVYSFDIKGKLISGFKFDGADQPIIAPVQHVKDNNNDYLIVTDSSRIYFLDRKGNSRLNLEKQFRASPNNLFEYQSGNTSRMSKLIRTSSDGTIHHVYFNGKEEQIHIADLSKNHYFNMEDVTGDKVPDFVFVDGNKLTVFSLKGDKEFEVTFSTPIKHKPAFYRFSTNQTAIGITEAEAHNIYLFGTKGEILKGFPLPGITRFSIGFLESGKGYNLIVGGDEQYLYNYKLN